MRTALGSSLLLLALSGLVAVPTAADAATICDAPDTTWVGPATWGGDPSWTVASNWSNGVPGADSAVCIPADTKADPLVPSGTTTTVAAVDALAATVTVEGSLTVTGSWDAERLDVTGGQVTLAGVSALRYIWLRDGGRLVVAGDATLGPGDQVNGDDDVPGLLVVAPSGVLTVDAPGDSAIVGGTVENHGTVHVVAGHLGVWGYSTTVAPVDGGSDGSWTAEPGTELWLEDYHLLLDGSLLEGVTLMGAEIPSGAVVTASRTHVWPSWSWPDPEPALAGGGELVLTDDSEVGWGVGDQVTVRIPAGEQAALDGWLQDDARAVVEGTATHARGTFAVLDSASLEVAPQGQMTWVDGDAAGWELPAHPSQTSGTVVVDQGGELVGGGAEGALVRGILDNHGTVRAEGGVLRATSSPGTIVDGVLEGGRWEVGARSSLALLDEQGAPVQAITANATQVSLDGEGARLRGLGALTTIRAAGVLELGAGASLGTDGRFRNAGTVTLDATASLSAGGRFVQSESGTLQVGVAWGAVGRVAAGGARDLAGTLQLSPAADGWPPPLSVRRDFITSDGRATPDDAFDVVRAPRLQGLKPRVHEDADRVWLRIVG